jgi:hypothetical protein
MIGNDHGMKYFVGDIVGVSLQPKNRREYCGSDFGLDNYAAASYSRISDCTVFVDGWPAGIYRKNSRVGLSRSMTFPRQNA